MSRRMTVATLVGAVLVAGLGGPALAGPATSHDSERETICIRTEGQSGAREGICVWVPLPADR
jgi:hypothetical protein